MGMFDYITFDDKVIVVYDIKCEKCGQYHKHSGWQTKDIDRGWGGSMSAHYVAYDGSKIRMWYLDEPDEKYWYEYSDDEIDQHNAEIDPESMIGRIFQWHKGDGYFRNEGFLPENRNHRSMGEFPHAWVETYRTCHNCGKEWIEVKLQFTDGIVTKIKIEREDRDG